MKCDFCGKEFELKHENYRLLPILDIREFPPRGVYACSTCLTAEGVDALVARYYWREGQRTEGVMVNHRRVSQMRLEVAA